MEFSRGADRRLEKQPWVQAVNAGPDQCNRISIANSDAQRVSSERTVQELAVTSGRCFINSLGHRVVISNPPLVLER